MNAKTWHKNVCDLKRCLGREFCLFVHVQGHWKKVPQLFSMAEQFGYIFFARVYVSFVSVLTVLLITQLFHLKSTADKIFRYIKHRTLKSLHISSENTCLKCHEIWFKNTAVWSFEISSQFHSVSLEIQKFFCFFLFITYFKRYLFGRFDPALQSENLVYLVKFAFFVRAYDLSKYWVIFYLISAKVKKFSIYNIHLH